MVTVVEAQRIAQQSRQRVAEQRKVIEGVRQKIEQVRARRLTRAELQRRTRADIIKRKQQLKQFQQLKQSQLKQLKPFDQQIDVAEQKVLSLEAQIRDIKDKERQFERGRKLAGVTGGVLGLETSIEKAGFDFGREQLSVAERRKKFFEFKTELAKVGLTPIFRDGELKGFSDEIQKVDIQLKDLTFIGEQRLKQLEKAGLLTAEVEIPLLTIEAAPGLVEQLGRSMRDATPDFDLTNTQIENLVEKAIGAGIGTDRFIRGKLSGAVASLRDAQGQRIFTTGQAEGLTNIAAEVSQGYIAGWTLGKVFTFGRGAYLTKVPMALRNNPTWQKTLSFLQFAGGAAITGVAVDSIVKTWRREGTNAAVIETLGFVGFGAGFRKTGLKTNVQAQKEFNKVAEFFKEHKITGIRGKKGSRQVAVVKVKKKVKKKDKKKVEIKKKFTQEEINELVGELEKRLLEAKTPEEQMKILAEIFSKLKTPTQKANFRKLIQFLIDKGVLKIKVVITGKKPITIRIKKPKIIKPEKEIPPLPKKPKKKKVVEEEVPAVVPGIFAAKQIFFDPQQIVPSQVVFEPVVTPGQLPQQIQTAKQRFNVLVTQGASQKLLQAQALKLLTLQKEKQLLKQVTQLSLKTPLLLSQTQRLRQRQKTKQKLRQKALLKVKFALKEQLKLRPKIRLRPSVRPPKKIILVPAPPFIPPKLPKGVESTPTVKALSILGGKGVNIVVGQEPKKQKVIGKNMAAFRALKKGLKFIDNTLDASFRLVSTGKKAKRIDIKPFNIGSRFRASKRDPKIIVERRFARLSSPKERRDIQFFRKSKIPDNLFSTAKPKKRKTTKKRRK